MSHRFIALLLVFPVLVHAAPLPKDKPPKPKTPGEVIIGTLQHEGEGKYTFTYTSYTQQPVYTQELVTTIVDGVEETNTANVVTLIPEAKQIKINLPSKGSKFIDVKGEPISDENMKNKCKTGIIAVKLSADNDAEWCKFLADDVVIIEMSIGMQLGFGSSPGLFDTKTDLPPVIIK